jgi:hypothetical protein
MICAVSASCRGRVDPPAIAVAPAVTDGGSVGQQLSPGSFKQRSHPAGLIPSAEFRMIDDSRLAETATLIEDSLADESKHVEPPCLLSQTAGRAGHLFPTFEAKSRQG